MYAILISMGIILILVFKLTAQNPAPTVTASTVPVSATVQQTRPAVMPQHSPIPTTPAPVAALSRDPSVLELGGTMLKGNQRVALINDDIYEVGNSIEGKKITEILLAEVKLVDEKTGEVSTLKVKSRR